MKKLFIIPIIILFILSHSTTVSSPIVKNNNSQTFLSELRENMDKKKPYNKTIKTTPYIENSNNQESAIYRTKTGSKYHKYGCKYLYKSCIETNMEYVIKKGLSPCSVCEP